MAEKIFIQIASYRDPELLPTLNNLLINAKYPENLTFGLVWQRSREDKWDNLNDYLNDKRFRILEVSYEKSGGMGWARSKTQSLYDNEAYTMQIDGHMRFAKNWDVDLLQMLNSLGNKSSKPFLTAYAFQYEPQNDKDLKPITSTLRPIAFKENGTLFFKSFANEPNQYLRPYKARLVGGHFFITLGQHCKEYAYDPELYYAGDELTLAVRSYTLGYDLYHPHKNVIWHYYKRPSNKKHWTDFDKKEKEEYNIRRIQQLLKQKDHGIDLGNYGLGTTRSLEDYEAYSGILLRSKKILRCAMEGIEPPVEIKDIKKELLKNFCIDINKNQYQRSFIVNFKQKIDTIKLDLIALNKNIIHTSVFSMSYIKENEDLRINYSGEEKPVSFRIECYENDVKNPKITINKDLEPDLQWI